MADIDEAAHALRCRHRHLDLGRNEDADGEPDVVMACAGDVPTLETLAAVDLLRKALPGPEDPGGQRRRPDDAAAARTSIRTASSDRDFDSLFTPDKPVIFAYHGYPYLIHRLTYRRTNHAGMHVRGFSEEGTTTTPFDMVVLNELDRFHLAIEAIERVPGSGDQGRAGASSTSATS